ncbi:MAG: nuclear transport factor 2 family protein [Sphingomonadales bacterium]|nr:nuclear transport factor 2 family protein [Sphingomonadales bacterium]MBD3773621.1 nuclear transport factor 2 family protein [Paracoccaceae bacterium]
MSAQHGIAAWHGVVQAGNQPAQLAAIIAEDAVFHSPVVHRPQVGRDLVVAYLAAAGVVLNTDKFRYVREFSAGDHALLEFETELDGIHINGVDIITFDEAGMIKDFKVMIRPLKAINKVWEMMGAQLAQS